MRNAERKRNGQFGENEFPLEICDDVFFYVSR